MNPASASWLVHDELERLAQIAGRTLGHAEDILEAKRRLGETDNHRDALHLLARIESLRCQIQHATETLRRIERREQEPASFRRTLPRSRRVGALHPVPRPTSEPRSHESWAAPSTPGIRVAPTEP